MEYYQFSVCKLKHRLLSVHSLNRKRIEMKFLILFASWFYSISFHKNTIYWHILSIFTIFFICTVGTMLFIDKFMSGLT